MKHKMKKINGVHVANFSHYINLLLQRQKYVISLIVAKLKENASVEMSQIKTHSSESCGL